MQRASAVKEWDLALNRSLSMQRSLRLSLSLSGVAAVALAGNPLLPAAAQDDGSADDLGVMSISLIDVKETTHKACPAARQHQQLHQGCFAPNPFAHSPSINEWPVQLSQSFQHCIDQCPHGSRHKPVEQFSVLCGN